MSTDIVKGKKGLGKGLASLIPSVPTEQLSKQKVLEIDIDLVIQNKAQPRKNFEKESLLKLAESIKQHGVVQPIVVRKKQKHFEIIAGERRWRAANLAGLATIPVVLKQINNQQAKETAIIENIQREDLNPIEEAEAYKDLLENYDLTHSEIAKRVSKDRATISNLLRILSLPSKVRSFVEQGKLSLGHAKALASVRDKSSQNRYADIVVQKKLSVRRLESLISKPTNKKSQDKTLKLVESIAQKLQKKLGTKISISYRNAKGRICIHYYSSEQFNGIVARLDGN